MWPTPLHKYKKFFNKKDLKNVDALLSIHSLESLENLTFYLAQKTKGNLDILNWRTRILDRKKELST